MVILDLANIHSILDDILRAVHSLLQMKDEFSSVLSVISSHKNLHTRKTIVFGKEGLTHFLLSTDFSHRDVVSQLVEDRNLPHERKPVDHQGKDDREESEEPEKEVSLQILRHGSYQKR